MDVTIFLKLRKGLLHFLSYVYTKLCRAEMYVTTNSTSSITWTVVNAAVFMVLKIKVKQSYQ